MNNSQWAKTIFSVLVNDWGGGSDSKTEMETGNPVFDNNESGKGEIPSTLDEGKTGNVKRKRIRCIKRGICTLEGTLDF